MFPSNTLRVSQSFGGRVRFRGVTAHEDPAGPLQFDRLEVIPATALLLQEASPCIYRKPRMQARRSRS
jgi:hypothetical protein